MMKNDLPKGLEIIALDRMPDDVKSGQGEWEWIRRLIAHEMAKAAENGESSVRRITCPNKKWMLCAQAAAQGARYRADGEGGGPRTRITNSRLGILTRSKPLSPHRQDGEYYLFIEVCFTR